MGTERTKVGSALDLMEGFLEEIRGSEKQAETGDGSEPTTLPYKGVSNNTQKATTGARAAENRADVKKHLGSGGIGGQEDADSAPNNSEKETGDMKRLTADDSAPQTIKDKPPKPGDGPGPGDETYDEKYASWGTKAAALLTKVSAAKKEPPVQQKTSENAVPKENVPTQTETKKAELELQKRAAAEKYREDAEAGYLAAQTMARQLSLGLSKVAEAQKTTQEEDALVQAKIASIRKSAEEDARLFTDFMRGHLDGLAKKAEPEPEPEPAPEEGGGAPPEAGGGEMPPEAGGGGGGQDPQAELEAIAAALEEAGITPEELAEAIAAVEQQGGGAPGGAPGGALGGAPGGMPPGAPPVQ